MSSTRRPDPTTPAERWAFFAVISAGVFLISLDNSILYTALPELNRQLDTTPTQALWIINAYPLMLCGLLLGTGALGDKIGHRLMFLTGLAIFGAASLAAAFAPSAWALVAARGVLGIGAATMMPATLALIRLTFADEQERNTAIGIWSSVAVVGAALGPLFGGALLEVFWWGSVFLINVPIVVAAIALTLLLAPENMPNPDKHWDVVSSLYALVTLSGLTVAIKEAANPERTPALFAAACAAVVVGAVAFTRRQARLADPLLTFDIFRSRLFAGGVVAAGGSMFVMIGAELQTVQKLQLIDALSPLQAGLTIVAMAAAAFPASALGGANLHRIGFVPLIVGGFAGGALGVSVLVLGSARGSLAVEVLALAVLGVSAGAVMSVSSIAILGAAPMHRSGMAAGVEEVSYEFGTLLTVAITGSLLGRWLALNLEEQPYEAAYTSAYHSVLGVIAVASALFALITLWCFRGNPKTAEVARTV